jgi:hypothetical protein
MNITTILAEKKENSTKLKKQLWILLKFKPLWLIKLNNNELTKDLVKGLKSLPAWFVVYIKDEKTEILSKNVVITWILEDDVMSWFDFIVCDNEIKDLSIYIQQGITPITYKKNNYKNELIEFNPLKNEGNSFFYENLNKWDIFYTIVRYMENYKFPFDNKNLVKNVLKK